MSVGRSAARWARGDRAAGGSAVEAELISRLRTLPGPAPEIRFRAELRAQLVAITARIVSESPAEAAPADRRSSAAGSRALRTLRRPVLALAGASTVLTLLLGMAVWMSSGSLPGQSLYGVKRASENVQLSLAGNDVAKGEAYLQLAGNRMHEVADLLSQPSAMATAGGLSAGTPRFTPRIATLVTETLDSADDDSVHGMQLLGRAAVAQLSKEPLAKMSGWLPQQRTLMAEIRDRIPAGALRTRAQASLLLLQRIATRTDQLTSSMGCPCLAQALADELGPLPCTGCAAVPRPAPGGGAATVPVPVPGLGSPVGPSGSLPSLSLPPLGGSGGSSSGKAGGLVGTQPAGQQPAGQPAGTQPVGSSPTASSLPSSLTSAPPPALPSSLPTGRPSSLGPIVIGSSTLPATLPGAVGSILPTLPTLPGVSRP
ncbi:MAG TPA: DUF5667 domain-containing protein [Jatrophihabitans sp.]|jgi:hypothetical protein|uniref:DUF5667 domain-containing protein n=1 Tax=Jatrophihabitans sp. TaxID=1932789 RepID=UPI002F175074